MLTQMRALSQNWIGRSIMAVVLGFIIVSFAVWGIGDRFTNFHANELARVGSEKISVDEFRNMFQQQLQQLQQKQRRNVTSDEARRNGLDRQILSRLVDDAALDQEAARLGLAVSDATIAQSIMDDDAFKGPTGRFDRMRFAAIMRDNGLTEARYVREQRGLILRQDLGQAVIGGLTVPKAMEAAINRYQSEVRDVEYFVLPPIDAGKLPAPTDAELKTFYDAHRSLYRAPEYRKITVLSLVPADLLKGSAISEDEVKKRYEAQKSTRFVVPEKRTVQQLVFADTKAAAAAKTKLDGGETFEKLAAEEKKSPADISLGTVAKNELNDPSVADAAFGLSENGTSAPIKTQFGAVLVHVSKIAPTRQQTLEEVTGTLKDDIAREHATQMSTKIENERTAGKTLTEAAASVKLKPRTIEAIDAEGRDKAHKPVEGLVEGPALLKAAFRTEAGADTEMLSAAGGGNVWYEVVSVDPSRELPLAQVKPQVEAAWRDAEGNRRLAAEGDRLVKAVDGGQTLEAVAAGVGGKPQIMKGTNLSRRGGVAVEPSAIGAMFGVHVGKAGSVDANQGRLVFKVVAARVPPVDLNGPFKGLMDQMKASVESDVLAQYVGEVQREIGVGINQKALQSALGTDAGT